LEWRKTGSAECEKAKEIVKVLIEAVFLGTTEL